MMNFPLPTKSSISACPVLAAFWIWLPLLFAHLFQFFQ